MASTANTIVGQVVTQLQLADGAGVYSFDLRAATGRVKRGAPLVHVADSVCDVWVRAVALRSRTGAALTKHTRELGIRIVGILGEHYADSATDREGGVLDLADTIMRAIETDRGLGGTVLDTFAVGAEVMDGSRLEDLGSYGVDEPLSLAGVPVVVVELVVSYYMTTGV